MKLSSHFLYIFKSYYLRYFIDSLQHVSFSFKNVLFTCGDEDAELKVVDFGFARMKPNQLNDETESSGMKTPCFTLQYAAPEVLDQASITKTLNNDKNENSISTETKRDGYNESCDLWSLGVILVRSFSDDT